MNIPDLLDLLDLYHLVITGTLLVLLGVTVANLKFFRRLPRAEVWSARADSDWPRVSVLVPARNEERCISACVESLCQQNYPNYHIVVLNDGSTDATGTLLADLQTRYQHLTVVTGSPLPDGWVGKSWACHQLSQQATGEYLLFTDADTVHQPDTLRAAVTMAEQDNLDFFSLIPYEELGTFGEHAVIPMVHMLYFSYLPNNLIVQNRRTSFSAANGQFMWFRRQAYEDVGGHTAVHNALVEDVFLAKVMKGAGKRIALVDGTHYVWCRMYTSAREVTDGFSKNFFPGTGYNLPLTTLFMVHLVTAYVAPLGFLLAGASLAYVVPQLAIAGAMRWMIARRFQMPWWHAFLQPATAAWSILIGVNSIRWAFSKKGAQWKGRSYQHRRTI
ncbi:MAG: glycosyltransferase [Candidatus Kapaibacteriota bacterium]